MEEIKNGEQLEITKGNVQSGIVENMDKGTTCPSEPSGSLGKFKDAESLLNAYNSLQAEFTRKCQKLSELMKNGDDKQREEINEQSSINDINEEIKNEPSINQSNNINENMSEQKEDSKPIFQNENWHEKVASFLKDNAEAKEYSGEIANEIMNDKNLQSSPYALELAWARIMKKEYAKPTNLAHDQNFIREQILSQDQIKMQVLQEYFKNIQNKKTPPVITSNGVVAGVTVKQPTTMNEAKQMVEKLFNLKGN